MRSSSIEEAIANGIGGCLQDHPRFRLAPRMIHSIRADAELRMIRAVIHPCDWRILGLEAIAHPTRQIPVGVLVKKPPSDAGLIGDDDGRPAQLIDREARQLENSWEELELVRTMDVTSIDIDHAVTIKKEGTSRHG